MAGPRQYVTSWWSALRLHLKLGEVELAGLYLGCMHKVRSVLLKSCQMARRVEYDMSYFLSFCLEKYTRMTGVSAFEKVSTPFLSEQDAAQCFEEEPTWAQLLGTEEWDGKYKSVKQLQAEPTDPDMVLGKHAKIAPHIVMKVLYAARMARYDLLRAVNRLACSFTRWDQACDRRVHRLICYISATLDVKQYGWVGDGPNDLLLALYADADFAGCCWTRRSTSGYFSLLVHSLRDSRVLPTAHRRWKLLQHILHYACAVCRLWICGKCCSIQVFRSSFTRIVP